MSRVLLILPALAAASCTGLYLDKGNAYPCDFSAGPGVRDEVCQPGDICGTNNVCQTFIYEGPRFEGKATLPEYGPASGEGEVLHPLVLQKPVLELVADLPLDRGANGYVKSDAGLFSVGGGHVAVGTPAFPSNFPPAFGVLARIQPFLNGPTPLTNVLLLSDTGRVAIATLGTPMLDAVQLADGGAFVAKGFRVVEQPSPPARAVPLAWSATEFGVVTRGQLNDWEFTSWVSNPGDVLDVAGLTVPARAWALLLLPDVVQVVETSDSGVSVAAVLDTLTTEAGAMKTDPGNRVVAAYRSGSLLPLGAKVDVLSTFQVNITSEGPALTSPWPDCVPCGDREHLELIAPSVRSGAPTVDVVCQGPVGLPTALRVVGSVALTQFDACLTEELDVPVSLARVAGPPGPLVQWDNQSGLFLGGRHGELWTGETLTSLLPEFLDRVPLDVAPANAGRTPSIAAITDDYLAVQQTEETRLPNERLNGFRRLPKRELGLSEDSRLLAFVRGVGGWAVTSGGGLVRVQIGMGNTRVEPGSQLVTSKEEPITSSIGGEAFTDLDGGAIGFFIAADDSLYFVADPASTLDPINDGQLELPDLTPEPSVPIRSLALERTRLGTDGKKKARGYLVTSRNVFAWELAGDPARWTASPRVLTSGEPVEVWFDSPRSALGRVGYRDGQIFSLPGGYQLAEPLPTAADGLPPQVFDYENLGGWPVAYASTGVFVAGWEQVDGKLQNRFDNGVSKPMKWTEVTLGGAEPTPWMRGPRAKPGKLFVAVDPPGDGGLLLHRLLLFTDDEVRQVAHHLRK
jgi:hypothetical protein